MSLCPAINTMGLWRFWYMDTRKLNWIQALLYILKCNEPNCSNPPLQKIKWVLTYLQWQISSPTVHQVDTRYSVLLCNLMGSKRLLHRDGIHGTSLEASIVGRYYAGVATDLCDNIERISLWDLAVGHVHSSKLWQLQAISIRVLQSSNTVWDTQHSLTCGWKWHVG